MTSTNPLWMVKKTRWLLLSFNTFTRPAFNALTRGACLSNTSNSPSTPGSCTPYTSALNNFFSGVNISRFISKFFIRGPEPASQVKGGFGIFVPFPIHDHVETADGFVDGNKHTFQTGELLGHME